MSTGVLRNKLEQLRERPAMEPRGWFRWLHDSSWIRCSYVITEKGAVPNPTEIPSAADAEPWRISKEMSEVPGPEIESLLHEVFAGHARTFGVLRERSVAERCWAAADPISRGCFLSGFSCHAYESEQRAWIVARLADVKFTAASACELGVNAMVFRLPEFLASALADPEISCHRLARLDDSRWLKNIEQISDTIADLLLEAALKERYLPGVEASLAAGANPNLAVWCLERSFNEAFSALAYAIDCDVSEIADALLRAGADPRGTAYGGYDQPLFYALAKDRDELADRLLAAGSSFSRHGGDAGDAKGAFYGCFRDELDWAHRAIGGLAPLVDVATKRCFYMGNGQGGSQHLMLPMVVGYTDNLERLKKYEALGLDTALSAEEICKLIDADAFRCLAYLLEKLGPSVCGKAFFRIRRRKPEFGAVRCEIETIPQEDRINVLQTFDPAGQESFELPDGSHIYANLDAIAPPGHPHGPCAATEFFCQQVEGVFRRRGDRVVMTKLPKSWVIAAKPENVHQFWELLPAGKEVGGRFAWLGVTIGKLYWRLRDRALAEKLSKWRDSDAGKRVIDEAIRRGREQDRANRRPAKPQLSEDELTGYPRRFWPHLIRLPNGTIGISEESCGWDSDLPRDYSDWERENKPDSTFVPDPRLLDWPEWAEVPEELKPFFIIDPLFDWPGVRFEGANEYENAMIRKAVNWKNGRMITSIKNALGSGPLSSLQLL